MSRPAFLTFVAVVLIVVVALIAGIVLMKNAAQTSSSTFTTYSPSCEEVTTDATGQNGLVTAASSESCTVEIPALTWYADYGSWRYAVTLSAVNIQQGSDITAAFTLTNVSDQTQTVDVVNPLVNPAIYSQNGRQVLWAQNPSEINEIENVTAHQSISLSMVLPAAKLSGGQSYILSTYPGIGSPGFTVNIGPHLQLNETITVS